VSFPQFTKEELTLIAAIVAAIGATIAATISLFSNSRSKYIDTITATRIEWVTGLRNDFSSLISAFTKRLTADVHGLNDAAKYALEENISDLMMLINLKLNRRSSLDREISKLMGIVLQKVHEGAEQADYVGPAAHLTMVVEELLKEEWEKAKYEASGPLRRVFIQFSKFRRKAARKQRRKRWQEAVDLKVPPPAQSNEQAG
jgi:hypothetical protein